MSKSKTANFQPHLQKTHNYRSIYSPGFIWTIKTQNQPYRYCSTPITGYLFQEQFSTKLDSKQSWSFGQNLRDRDETLTLRDRDETETLSKNSRRDTRLLKLNVCNILQIFLTLNFRHSVSFSTHCNIDFFLGISLVY